MMSGTIGFTTANGGSGRPKFAEERTQGAGIECVPGALSGPLDEAHRKLRGPCRAG